MVTRFEFATAARIVAGPQALNELGPAARSLGRRALVVTGRNPTRAEPILAILQAHGLEADTFAIPGEPTLENIEAGARYARQAGIDLVIGFGGGSPLDAAKAIAAMVTNPGNLLDYLEVIGQAKPLANPAAPIITIPTTAGTGAEVTRNAVLASAEHRVKVSMRSPHMLPRLAIVDPELTYTLPPDVTAATGMDALTQLIEPLVSGKANPMTDALCREGLARISRSIRVAYRHGEDSSARGDMSIASLFGGLALANAGLGVVHGFAGPVGGMFPAPHGAVCAALLPSAIDVNARALAARAPGHPALERYAEIARILTGGAESAPAAAAAWVRHLCVEFAIPPLRAYRITQEDLPVLCQKAAVASSTKGNPIVLTLDELRQVVEAAW